MPGGIEKNSPPPRPRDVIDILPWPFSRALCGAAFARGCGRYAMSEYRVSKNEATSGPRVAAPMSLALGLAAAPGGAQPRAAQPETTAPAAAARAATHPEAKRCVEALHELPPPTGQRRYRGGVLSMMSLLHVSGPLRAWS